MPPFPQELTDMVVDVLCDDSKALSSLTLTSQSWSLRSRKYLHKTLKIRHNGCIIFPAREVTRAKALLELPGLTELAQELVLDEYNPNDTRGEHWRMNPDDYDSNWADLLGLIVERCTNIRHLTIAHISWGLRRVPLAYRQWFCLAFPQITSLAINAGTFSDPEEFIALLNLMPPLTRLTINDCINTCPQSNSASRQLGKLRTKTTKLNLTKLQELVVKDSFGLEGRAFNAIVTAFEENPPSLRTFDVGGCWDYLVSREPTLRGLESCIRRLVGTVCTTLTTLRLHFWMFDNRVDSYFKDEDTDVKLDRCTALKTIEFHFCRRRRDLTALEYSTWDVIPALVRTALPSSLRSMKVVCIPDTQNIGLFDFGEVDRTLTQSIPSLESLIFEDALDPRNEAEMLEEWNRVPRYLVEEVPRVLGYQEFHETIMAKLPNLAASGVLRVTSQMRKNS